MPSGTDGSMAVSAFGSFARTVLSVRNIVMVVAGVLAGASLVFLGEEAVVVPLIGSAPGILVGAVGFVTALAIYRQAGCNCSTKECGCSDECGDSCSYDPYRSRKVVSSPYS